MVVKNLTCGVNGISSSNYDGIFELGVQARDILRPNDRIEEGSLLIDTQDYVPGCKAIICLALLNSCFLRLPYVSHPLWNKQSLALLLLIFYSSILGSPDENVKGNTQTLPSARPLCILAVERSIRRASTEEGANLSNDFNWACHRSCFF